MRRYIIGAFQACIAIGLLLPAPFNEPAVQFCLLSKSSNGRTAIITLTGFMVFMLLAPLWDLYRLHVYAEAAQGGGSASLERRSTPCAATLYLLLLHAL